VNAHGGGMIKVGSFYYGGSNQQWQIVVAN
jgi:hypothetical protein